MNDINKKNSVGGGLAKLTDSTSKMATTIHSLSNNNKPVIQVGGSLNKNSFGFIVNPKTGRRVNVKTNLGRKIILTYISNIN